MRASPHEEGDRGGRVTNCSQPRRLPPTPLLGSAQVEEVRLRVLDELRGRYRPEFLNRLDETVIFNALGRDQLDPIIRLQVKCVVR